MICHNCSLDCGLMVGRFCRRCGFPTANEGYAPGERELFNRGNVVVTTRRIVLDGTMLSPGTVVAVRIATRENFRNYSLLSMCFAVVLASVDFG